MRTPVIAEPALVVRYIGIDPGLGGVLAVITESRASGRPLISSYPTPVLRVKKARGKGHMVQYALSEVGKLLRPLRSGRVIAGLEYFGSRPGQSAQSTFSIGFGLGIWEMALAALEIPYTRVYPQVWKKTLNVQGPKDDPKSKTASVLRARQLFPWLEFPLVKDHNRADAILIAEYMRRTHSL